MPKAERARWIAHARLEAAVRRYQAHASYFDDMDISLGDFVQMDEETQGFHEKSAAKLASEGGV